MLIYSRHDDVAQITDPDSGETFTPDETGAFIVPAPFAYVLLDQHVAGEKAWEASPERQDRLQAEADARRRDPLALIDAVEKLQARPAPAPETPEERKARAEALRAEADLLDPPKRRRRTA